MFFKKSTTSSVGIKMWIMLAEIRKGTWPWEREGVDGL